MPRLFAMLLLPALLVGCDVSAPPAAKTEAPAPPSAFQANTTGTIAGQVRWTGPLPQVPPIRAPFSPLSGHGPLREWPHPNLPLVDPKSQGVKDAVVFLRDVDATKSRPWDQPQARVEFRDDDLFVVQGDYVGRRGFVLHGEAFEVVSKQAEYESLQVRGDAFFTLTLATDQPRSRRLTHLGVAELSSGVARFWMRGHLFIVEHPYYTRTDAEGRFTLPQVPPGTYQLVCWHPNWHEDVREHDADTYFVSRLTFRPAAEVVREIVVKSSETAEAAITLSQEQFPR